MKKKTHTIEFCKSAKIEYHFFDYPDEQIAKDDYEHIQSLIKDGYNQGELVHNKDVTGWWNLKG